MSTNIPKLFNKETDIMFVLEVREDFPHRYIFSKKKYAEFLKKYGKK